MPVISLTYFCFIAVLMAIYYLCPGRFRWEVLLAGSVIFYILNSSVLLFAVMAGEVLWAYVFALSLEKLGAQINCAAGEGRELLEKKRKRTTGLAVTVPVLLLLILQDNAFFLNNFNRFLPQGSRIPAPQWAVPLGISYYTLILVGYLLDVSWQTGRPQKNPLKLLLFTCYFPQTLSGPLTRYRQIEGSLFAANRFDHVNIERGAQRVLWGLFKKLVIAERLGVIVRTIHVDSAAYPGFYIPIAAVGYTLQLYADFSGHMDMVLGVSEMFGVRLPENFQTPFVATNLSEVWRRWHMTLGFWVKDYVLYPFLKSPYTQKIGAFARKKWGKKAGKRVPTYCGMFVTWFAVGFWHGGSWKYIFGSGLFFFMMIAGGMLLDPVFRRVIQMLRVNTGCFSWRLFQRVRTFCLFSASISFGRAASLSAGFAMWKRAFYFNPWIFTDGSLYNIGLDQKDFHVLLAALFLLLMVSVSQQKVSIRETLARQNLPFRWGVLLGLIFSILLFGFYGPGYDSAQFVYAGF